MSYDDRLLLLLYSWSVCKPLSFTRILNDIDETIQMVKEFEAIGISAIGVHGRKKHERPQHPVSVDAIRKIVENVKIPVIANGGSRDMEKHSDILRFRELTGAPSVMIARAAQWNVSIFNKGGPIDLERVMYDYLKLCIEYDNSPHNSKYCIQMMLRDMQESERGRKFLDCQTLEEIWYE